MFKMKFNKALALLASLMILCTSLPLGALLMAGAEGDNLVVNGDFENGTEGWTLGSSAAVVAGGYNSDNALQLSNPGAWSEAAMQTVSVTPNTVCTISWAAKRVSGSGVLNLALMNGANANYSVLTGQNWMNETSGNWVEYTVTINTGDNDALKLKFTSEMNNAGVLLVDNVTVIDPNASDEPVEPAANGVVNGDFENGTNGWTLNGTTALSTDAHEGSGALLVSSTNQYEECAYQVISLYKNTDYTLSWYGKRVSGTDAYCVFPMNEAGFANMPVNGQTWMNETSGNWVKYEVTFNSGDVEQMRLKWGPDWTAAGGSVLVDDIVLTAHNVPDQPDEPDQPTDNMLVNGDFETGDTTGWENLWGSNTVSIVDGRDGGKAMNVISGEWKHVRQLVAVEANTDYVITGWFKDVTDMTLLVKDGADSVNMSQTPVNGGADWTQVVAEFNSGSNTQVYVSLMGNVAASKGTFDDFVMVKKGGDEPDQPDVPDVPVENMLANGDFETGDITGWDNLWGSNTVTIVDGRNGGKAMNVISGEWKHVRQLVAVEANTDYVITGWYKDVTDMTLLVKDGADSVNMSQTPVNGGADWTMVTAEFNSGSNTQVYVSLMGNVANSKGIFDDFVMVKKGDEPDQPDQPDVPADNMLANGDFETGDITGWDNLWGSNTVTIVDGRNGGKAMNVISGEWKHVRQLVAVEADTDYVITGWFKDVTDMTLLVKDGADSKNLSQTPVNGGADWTQVTAEFNSGSNTQVYVSLMGNVAESKGTFDDFVMVKKTGTEPDQPDQPDVPAAGLQNGNFEAGNSGWTMSGAAAVVEGGYNSGHALQLQNPAAWSEAAKQEFAVEPNTDYVITWWSKRVQGAGPFNMVIMDGSNNMTTVEGQNWMNETSGEWVKNTYVVNSGASSLMLVKLTSEASNSGIILVDELVIAKKSALSAEIINGGFESGDEGWSLGGSAAVVEGGYNSDHALQVTNPGAWAEAAKQELAVEANTKYTITWWSKRVEGTGPFNLVIMGGSKNMTTVEGQNWMNETSGEWVQNTYVVDSGDATTMLVKVTSEADNAGIILLDDIVVAKTGDEPVNPYDPTANQVVNGDFAAGQDGWKWQGNTAVDTSNGYYAAPSALLDMDKEYGEALTQMVTVVPNTDYVITFYTKRVSGHGSWDLFLMDGATIENGSPVNVETDGNRWFQQGIDAGWVKTRLEFNSGEMTKVFFKFGPEAADSGVFLLDDVSMYEKAHEPEEPDEPVVPVSSMALHSYGVLNGRPISADKNLLQNSSFESAGGQWEVDTFHTDYVSVVADSDARDGSKSLFFNTSALSEANATTAVFWMDLEVDTAYVFSAWIKGALLADDNRGRNTIGVMDEYGSFLLNREIPFLDGTRQLVPPSWDNEWHLVSVEFHTGSNTKAGIALAGWGSKMWVDDMALFKVGDGTKYVSANMAGGIQLSYDFEYIGCADKDSLIPDPNMKTADKANFWSGSHGWRNGFLTFADNEYEYGASMKYTSTGDAAATYIIKWVDVKPNTQYTFAVDVKILEDGFGRIALLDNKLRDKAEFFSVSFDNGDYEDYDNTGWRTVVTSFNSNVYDRIGIAVVDDGGEALIDNMRLFENVNGKNVVDAFIPLPVEDEPIGDEPVDEDPTEEDEDPTEQETTKKKKKKVVVRRPGGMDPMIWVWIGIGSAVALAGAAVVIIILVSKKKKAAAAAAAAAAAEEAAAEAPETPEVTPE